MPLVVEPLPAAAGLSPALHAGVVLDTFRIEKLIARSGMASIYQATDLRDGRHVALKIPHPEMETDPIFLDRFRREEEIGSDLNHPAVMKVFADDLEQGRSRRYIVMEWIEGRLLRDLLIERKALAPDRAVAITLRICRALGYIHGAGVVHRDLKPENIMIDAADEIKLIDFGIAGRASSRQLTFGRLSQVMGTPDYISPEQVGGRMGDARSDIFALGVMLYEMLTGQAPFRGPNAFAIMNDRVVNNPVPPRQLRPEISPALQEIIYRAMRRDPAERYASAEEFAWDLEHQESIQAEDHPEFHNWSWRKRPVIKTAGVYAGLALIPVVIFSLLVFVTHYTK
jgi:serine/threonine protein kinase